MWWRMLHRGGAPRTNVHGAMEKLKAVWYTFVPAGMSLPNLQVTPRTPLSLKKFRATARNGQLETGLPAKRAPAGGSSSGPPTEAARLAKSYGMGT
eukprot:1838020-Rhodomonas_salina.1